MRWEATCPGCLLGILKARLFSQGKTLLLAFQCRSFFVCASPCLRYIRQHARFRCSAFPRASVRTCLRLAHVGVLCRFSPAGLGQRRHPQYGGHGNGAATRTVAAADQDGGHRQQPYRHQGRAGGPGLVRPGTQPPARLLGLRVAEGIRAGHPRRSQLRHVLVGTGAGGGFPRTATAGLRQAGPGRSGTSEEPRQRLPTSLYIEAAEAESAAKG